MTETDLGLYDEPLEEKTAVLGLISTAYLLISCCIFVGPKTIGTQTIHFSVLVKFHLGSAVMHLYGCTYHILA